MVAPQAPYPQSSPPPSGGGTSKIVPVVVSAGLAVGVFAGLLFGLGTGEVAAAGKRGGSGTEVVSSFDVGTEEYDGTGKAPADAGPVDAGAPPADAAVAATDAAPADAAPADAAPVPAIKLATVTFAVTPPGVTAKITVDGKPVEGEVEVDISGGAKEVEVIARAPGFRDFKKKISIGKDESIAVDLIKRPVGTPTGGQGGKRPDGNSGKIDI